MGVGGIWGPGQPAVGASLRHMVHKDDPSRFRGLGRQWLLRPWACAASFALHVLGLQPKEAATTEGSGPSIKPVTVAIYGPPSDKETGPGHTFFLGRRA